MSIILKEQSAALSNIPTYMQLWVKNTAPTELWHTNEDNTGWSGKISTSGYEYGTWTPVLTSSADSYQDVCSYYSRSGRYLKIGWFVWLWVEMSLSSKGTLSSGGNPIIVWLPWVADWNYFGNTCVTYVNSMTLSAPVDIQGQAYNGDYPLINLYKSTQSNPTFLVGSEIGSTAYIYCGAFYKTIYEGEHGRFGSTYQGH